MSKVRVHIQNKALQKEEFCNDLPGNPYTVGMQLNKIIAIKASFERLRSCGWFIMKL